MGRGRSEKSVALVETASAILEEIQPASVRAVCYQLFTRGVIDGMDKASTNRVGPLPSWISRNGGGRYVVAEQTERESIYAHAPTLGGYFRASPRIRA